MESVLQMVAAAVLATVDFCAAPIGGGAGEPQFCRVDATQEIDTPFFSIKVEPGLLVGVGREGRYVQIQPALWQSPGVLTIERVEDATSPNWVDCAEVVETIEDAVTWQDCHKSENGIYERRLAANLKGGYVLIRYSYSASGAALAPALERMMQSVRIHSM
jgi:hypothetical protein